MRFLASWWERMASSKSAPTIATALAFALVITKVTPVLAHISGPISHVWE